MTNGQKGFGAVEALLFLILLSILGFTGYYVYHTRNNANSTYNSAATTPVVTASRAEPKTQDAAVKQAQTVYNSLSSYNTTAHPNSPSIENKPWDINFINGHKTWFTTSFMSQANASSQPDNKYFLMCFGGSAYLDGFNVNQDTISGTTANVIVQAKQHGQLVDIKVPVTLQYHGSKWLIDSVDTSVCT